MRVVSRVLVLLGLLVAAGCGGKSQPVVVTVQTPAATTVAETTQTFDAAAARTVARGIESSSRERLARNFPNSTVDRLEVNCIQTTKIDFTCSVVVEARGPDVVEPVQRLTLEYKCQPGGDCVEVSRR